MWSLEARSALAQAGAAAFYLAGVALFVLFQEIGLRLRREESRAWWAGSGRDVLNAIGLGAITGALWAYGFPLSAAVVVGATLTLALFGTSIFVERRSRLVRPRAWALAAGLAMSAPVLLYPSAVLRVFGRIAATLFPLAG